MSLNSFLHGMNLYVNRSRMVFPIRFVGVILLVSDL